MDHDDPLRHTAHVSPFSEGVLPRHGKAFVALPSDEVTGHRDIVNFMAPPVGLSVITALDDQVSTRRSKRKDFRNNIQLRF